MLGQELREKPQIYKTRIHTGNLSVSTAKTAKTDFKRVLFKFYANQVKYKDEINDLQGKYPRSQSTER